MKLTPRTRKLVGALTWWPPIYFVIFFAFIVLWALGIVGAGVGTPLAQHLLGDEGAAALSFIILAVMLLGFGAIFIAHALTILLMFGLLAIYVVHVVQNTALPQDQRLMWVLLVLFAGPIGQLVYYYQVLKAPEAVTGGSPAQAPSTPPRAPAG